jgi:iron complex outermembrane receptor protein
LKNSISYFNREISIPAYRFGGTQMATFSEATYTRNRGNSEWISGLNLWTENFQEKRYVSFPARDYNQTVGGAFVQHLWKMNRVLHLETGLRSDYVGNYGAAFLPRVSMLLKFNEQFTSRIGGGLGYKAPTLFTEESERIQFQQISPIDKEQNRMERSYGVNADFNIRKTIADKIKLSINQLFFYTQINRPLLLKKDSISLYRFQNSSGNILTAGAETNVKIEYEDFKLFLGYTFTNTRLNENGKSIQTPLTPRHRINSILMYEVEEKWKVGLEAYYFDKQQLNDGKIGKSYLLCGFMAEKLWEQFSIYVNFENFLDARQTRFDSIYTGSISNPVFRDIYAPLDGFLINAGIKLKL